MGFFWYKFAPFYTNFLENPNISFLTQIIKIDINLIYLGKNQFSNVENQFKNLENGFKNLKNWFKKRENIKIMNFRSKSNYLILFWL